MALATFLVWRLRNGACDVGAHDSYPKVALENFEFVGGIFWCARKVFSAASVGSHLCRDDKELFFELDGAVREPDSLFIVGHKEVVYAKVG